MLKVLALVGCAAALVALVAAPSAIAEGGEKPVPAGAACEQQTLEFGIGKATGCFEKGDSPSTFTAAEQIELNGFTLGAGADAPITINTETRHLSTNGKEVPVSVGSGAFSDLGNLAFDFTAPTKGDLLIGEVRDAGAKFQALLLMPVVEARTPMRIVEGGEGRIDLTIDLSGIFKLLKDRRLGASVTLDVVEGKGVVFDGVQFNAEGFTVAGFGIDNLKGEFSPVEKTWGGSLELKFPAEGRGVAVGFKIKDETLVDLEIGATHLNLALIDGVFLQKLIGDLNFDHRIAANLETEVSMGPEINIFGQEIAAGAVDGHIGFDTGDGSSNGFFDIGGDVKVVRIPVFNADVKVFFNGAFSFKAQFGSGFPSFTQDENQPFFVGGDLAGWFHGQRWMLDGHALVKAFFLVIAEGEGVISDKGAAVCGTFFGKPSGGGGFSFATRLVEWFPPFTCGIGKYKESASTRRALAASGSGALALGPDDAFLRISAPAGAQAPGFQLEGPAGESIVHDANDPRAVHVEGSHVIVQDDDAGTTHVVLARPGGDWQLSEVEGGGQILTAERAAGKPMPKVRARVVGKGRKRKLVWNAKRANRHQFQFQEVFSDGTTHPILRTRRKSGSRRFRPLEGGHYSRRKLEVAIQQRYSQRGTKIVDRYRVRKPKRLGAPRHVRAQRIRDRIRVRWSGVRGAHGYAVEVIGPDGSFGLLREPGRGERSTVFRGTPAEPGTIARVRAFNRDSVLGHPARKRVAFTRISADLRTTVRRSLRSAKVTKRYVRLALPCPSRGHCDGRARVKRRGRVVAESRFENVPAGTAARGRLKLPGKFAHRLRKGRTKAMLKVVAWQLDDRRAGSRRLGR